MNQYALVPIRISLFGSRDDILFRRQKSRADRNANYNGDTNKNFNKDLCPLSKIPLWDFLFLLLDLTQQPSHSGQNSKGISEDSKYRRATANQDNIEARALGPIPVK